MTATLTEAYVRRIEEFYSPGQPRDRRGRWSKGGSGPVEPQGSAPASKVWSGMSADPKNRVAPTPTRVALELLRHNPEALAKLVFEGDLGGGYKSKVTDVSHDDFGGTGSDALVTMAVTGVITHGSKNVGSYTRMINLNGHELSAHHDLLEIEPEYQGQGIADRFNAHAISEYQQLGVDHVSLEAGLEVGGYAWARQGFRFNPVHSLTRQQFVADVLKSAQTRAEHVPNLRPHKAQLLKDIEALRKASDAGEDVQPIHLASLGEKYARTTGYDDRAKRDYVTWPGKSALLGRSWMGIYYFDAARPVTAAASSLEHAALRPAYGLSAALTEALACHTAACRPPTSGGSGGSLRQHTLPDVSAKDVRFAYRPRHPDGHADPGEIVWAHVPFEDNPKVGKDRPVLIVGRTEAGNLVGVQLSTKGHHQGSFPIEWGTDKSSFLRPDRFIQVDATNYRKEGAYVKKPKFQEIVDTISKQYGLTTQTFILEEATFACHDASCRPPTSGGTGGSLPSRSGFSGMSAKPGQRTVPVSKLTGMDKEEVTNEVRSWYEGSLPHGYKSVVSSIRAVTASSGEVSVVRVVGKIKNEFDRNVGDFERSVILKTDRKGTVAYHESLVLDGSAQNKGIADAFNSHAVAQYQRMGVDRVETNAGYSVGGYAWAVAGFRLRPDPPGVIQQVIGHARTKLDQLSQAAQVTSYQRKSLDDQLSALSKAAISGEDIQPIHIASLGREIEFEREGTGGKYKTWPGKEMMLGSDWPGEFLFDASA